ncbi:succinate dehydrogenase assembly factor 2 [Methylotenera sp.]|uniref:FAD assembly factor SdhE n=1 Tax=Methylotenera sp. TaxID=2051956 RepID=UPI00271A18C3|nr:succinate dehydrogenase assembly factor 2 [Methylotenera sp.]MDO9205644.1 succinate dehydrogenase assembly factor 2 [Methylotenera sp.]MDO9393532.1 succinate dehydrogenase assembly factor 2 [Methylotenera sp.]MDP1523711.1 succinate dehydrogenase assembly factor 2 [Methylotenera sp.]MDP2070422.1 succinate dehydrogenase assembly factor 2 [Methylotenera sp.]MDP2230436.1 succinate dehydrogenase assembly factor 2 [Methylotenera sp.]
MWFLETQMGDKKSMTEEEVRRLSWRCRRGLLELDIVLQRFSENHLATLSAQELLAFDSLLDLPDNEFLDVVTSRIKFTSIDVLTAKQLDALAMQSVLTKLSVNEEING